MTPMQKYELNNTLDNALIEIDRILNGLTYKITNLDFLTNNQKSIINRIRGHLSNIERLENE